MKTTKTNTSTFPHIIFSYGSNMCEKELMKYKNQLKSTKTQHFNLLDIGILPNYKFAYKNICEKTNNPKIKSAKATIIPTKNRKVYGTIIELSDDLFKLIVKKEGVYKNYYQTETLNIESLISNKTYNATVFIMNKDNYISASASSPASCNLKISNLPSVAYETKIVNAAKFYNFPYSYINKYLMSNR